MQFKLKGIIFDMDGVITNTMPDHHKAWDVVLKKRDLNLSYHDVYIREGQPGDEALKEIFAEHNYSYAPEDIDVILAEKEAHFKENAVERYVVGARSFLKRKHREGFLLSLVTGTSRHEVQRILPPYLFDLFDVIITGNDVTRGKPHPEPFQKAVDRMSVLPQDVVVIENAPYGIRSAKAAGLTCLALETSLPREFLKDADYVFCSFKDLVEKVTFQKQS